ncbi:MAG: peptidase C13, partial [Xanthomonadales bacterium]|nr:peptidase C13 [Xanthomonadales bacterium]
QQLFDQRFGTRGRSLALLNHPDSTERKPLATLSNLRLALQGVAQRMDTEQDLLLLFLTSHGSDDHQLYVDLLGLPLDQIEPNQLRAALDDSGIRWRVLVVSACYSGGFIDALADPRTLIITAAREDRSSFGCGPDSDFTYFGRAYFIHALNQTSDFQSAFKLAAEEIAEREAEEERLASEPQIRVGAEISAQLEAWQRGFDPGPALTWPMAEQPEKPVARIGKVTESKFDEPSKFMIQESNEPGTAGSPNR